MFDEVLYTAADGIARITLNRPEKLNALTVRGYEGLIGAFRQFASDDSVAVGLLSGNGRAFCAGGDFQTSQTVLTTESAARHHFFARMIETSNALLAAGKPIVCAVQGACVGGGAELMMFADYVIADETAFFLFNGTALGGCSWWGAPQLLPGTVGLRRAEHMLLLSERVPARHAERIGLVNRVVVAGELEDSAQAVCVRLLERPELARRFAKRALGGVKELLLRHLGAEAELNAAALGRPEYHAARREAADGKSISWRAHRVNPTPRP